MILSPLRLVPQAGLAVWSGADLTPAYGYAEDAAEAPAYTTMPSSSRDIFRSTRGVAS